MINNQYLPLTLKSMDHIRSRFKSTKHHLHFYIVGIEPIDISGKDITFILSQHTDMPILWARVHLPEMLGVDKFIFIDSDTITLTCISRLWDVDLQGNILGAAVHCACPTFGDLVNNWRAMNFKPFNDELHLPYFNCGVMMIDSDKWLNSNIPTKCLEAIQLYKHTRHRGYDEPGFNYILKNQWKQLDQKWNYLPLPGKRVKACHILHYYGEYPTGTPRHSMF